MKAIVCEKYGPPSDLVLKELPSLTPGEKEVVVSVKACSLNFPDTLIIQGKYQYKPSLPFTPGSDIAGVVKAVGSGVKHLKVGDEVFGFVANGGFAEEVLAPAKNIFPKPPKMDNATGASFLMAYGTSYHALKNRARLKANETLVVLGASGGVGLAAVELGKQIEKISDSKEEDQELLGHLFLVAGKVARQLGIEDAFRLVVNNGAGAQQTVFHLHIHLIAEREFSWPPG